MGSPFIGRVREVARARHLAYKTEQAYVGWIRRCIRFHGMQRPENLGEREVSTFLTQLATRRHVAASTQNQALAALLFLYKDVLGRPLGEIDSVRAKKPRRLPVVLSRAEVGQLLQALRGDTWLQAALMYGAGLRLMECLRLRVKDLDFGRMLITVYDGKGSKDRVTVLPDTTVDALRTHLAAVRIWYQQDLDSGAAGVHLPYALERKYPDAGTSWPWQWVFPARRHGRDPRSGRCRRSPSLRARAQVPGRSADWQTGYISYAAPFVRHPPA